MYVFNRLYFIEHPRSEKPPIRGPQHPSINEYINMNMYARNRSKHMWNDFVVKLLEDRGLTNMKIKKCNVIYRTFVKDRRRHDPDNITPKFIFDAFVEAGFIEDDNMEHILSLTIEMARDFQNPRIEFEIEVLEV